MTPVRFRINLDLGPSAVYVPGQVVGGKVDLWLEKDVKIRGINLDAKGEAKVHWVEEKVSHVFVSGYSQTECFTSREQYFHEKIRLLEQDGESFFLAAGHYQYPFNFQLPTGIPSSFEDDYGHVRYGIKVVLDCPWTFNYETASHFIVNSINDLNSISIASEPVRVSASKTICCWCCASGPIEARAWINRTGYVAGDNIWFCAEVENLSGREMFGSRVRLVQINTFHAEGESKIVERVLSELQRGAFKDEEIWDNVPIAIPSLPPSGLPHCSIINIEYRIEFHVNPGTCSMEFFIPLNIIIGNVALQCSLKTDMAGSVSPSPDVTAEVSDLPQSVNFKESFEGNFEDDDAEPNNGTLHHEPRYITYRLKR